MLKKWLPVVFAGFIVKVAAQTQPHIGISNEIKPVYAFTHATVHIRSGEVKTDATLLIRDHLITAVGEKVDIPKGAQVIDCTGKHIYASFIETYSNYGLAAKGIETNTETYYWNEAIKSHYQAAFHYSYDDGSAAALRKYGVGTVLTHQQDGIVRGTASLVALADIKDGKNMLVENAAWFGSLDRGTSTQEYPTSLTGSIALLRQFLYDAQWYADMKGKADKALSLDLFNRYKNLPVFFKVDDKSDILRLEKVAREFSLTFHYIGTGEEFEHVAYLEKIPGGIAVPLHYPKAYNLNDVYDADMVSLEDLYNWDMAPANLHYLDSHKMSFCITTHEAEDADAFFRNLRKAIRYGLSVDKALYALTEAPARFLKIEDKVGTLEKGKLASFIITTYPLDNDKFSILENWVMGKQYLIQNSADRVDIRGTYAITSGFEWINGKSVLINGSVYNPSGFLHYSDTIKLPVDMKVEKNLITAGIFSRGLDGFVRVSVSFDVNKKWTGTLQTPDGKLFPLSAVFTAPYEEEPVEKDTLPVEYAALRYPNMAYGWKEGELKTREGKQYLIKNVTVWTNEKEGIVKNQDVITADGKIKKIGSGLSCSSCEVIDGTGMHLTSGIIDEHSHIAMTRGVNESGQSSSAEVRMGDVLNASDINIYRQLSGGVTTAQLLHGSANAIGGQSAIIKLRWGRSENELLFEDAPGFIKFALGENVKQSNWGDHNVTRYPQTRMGVEQFYFEMFSQAKAYEAKKKSSHEPVRKDLELETLLEILHGERYITCHSYVQSEINMLMHVADSMGFKVNTFTHILEGYKVADKMKEHGANASTFSDWWAYKMEVNDAIPYNAAILSKVGVNTSVNSDDAEMARRLNQEAAKAVKYGGLSEEEAWKLCTLNPAKMLHIDDKVGSVKEGKHADLVLWTANPLSIYARVKFTMIDGIIYYDEDRDKQLQESDRKEKNRLVQKMMKAVKDGEEAVPLSKKQYFLYDCESLENSDVEYIQMVD